MKTSPLAALSLLLSLASAFAADVQSAALPAGFHLTYEQSFAKSDSLKQFVFTDPTAWKLTGNGGDRALELVQQSKYEPAVRSPFNIALIADRQFGDFILEADLLQTGKDYGHRDMCLFFGFQNPKQFYYVHMATAADEHAHNIFIVNNEPRTKIATRTTKGIDWGRGEWHHVRLERRLVDGVIKVYFDNMDHPIMEAKNTTFGAGNIGFGSFDDTGKVRNIKIWTPSKEKVGHDRTEFFKRD